MRYKWKRNEPYVDNDGGQWDKDWILHAMKWRLRWKDQIEGLYWDDPLVGPDGIAFHLFVFEDTPDMVIDRALIAAYRQRDIVYHKVWQIPKDWVEVAQGMVPTYT